MQITARHVPRGRLASPNGLGDLGLTWAGLPAIATVPPGAVFWDSYPIVIPPAGLKEHAGLPTGVVQLCDRGGCNVSGQTQPERLVTPTFTGLSAGDRGGQVSVTRPNPHYAPPGAVQTNEVLRRAQAGQLKVSLSPMARDDKASWLAQRGAIGLFNTYVVGAQAGSYDRGGVYGASSGVTYTDNPQNWLNMTASTQYGMKKGYIGARDWMDKLSSGVEFLIQAVVIAGIGYGVASAAMAASAAAPAAAAPASSGAIMPGAQAVASGATGGILPSGAAAGGLVADSAAAAGYVMPGAGAVTSGATGGIVGTTAGGGIVSTIAAKAGSTLLTAGTKYAAGIAQQQLAKFLKPAQNTQLPGQPAQLVDTAPAPQPGTDFMTEWKPALTAAGALAIILLAVKAFGGK